MQITLAGSALSRPATDAQQESVSLELAAFDGEVGNSTVAVPDPTGLDEVVPGLQVLVSEGTTVLLDGRIVSEGRERGSSPAAGQKQDTYQVDDPNTFMFGFRVVADRPEESDYARVQWFFDTYLPAADTTFVLNTSTSTMVAASYASDGVADIMRDAIDLTGKTLFIHDVAAGGLCAHWHALTGGHTCGLTISDVFGDPNGTTVWYPQNPARVRDGADLANDILAYGADETIGPVNVTDGTSIATYDADDKLHQTFANFPAATDIATLTADANRLLETNKDPRDSFTATIGPLDATALALIRAGDIITVTSEVLGLSASPQRISRLRLTVSAGNTAAPGLWDATLTMGAPVRGPGGRFGRSVARPPSTWTPTPIAPFTLDDDNSYWVRTALNMAWDCATIVETGAEVIYRLSATEPLVGKGCAVLPNWWRIGQMHSGEPDPDLKKQFTDRIYVTNSAGTFSGTVRLSALKVTSSSTPKPADGTVQVHAADWPLGLPFTDPDFEIDVHDLRHNATVVYPGLTFPVVWPATHSFTSGGYYYWTTGVNVAVAGRRQFMIDSTDEDDDMFWIGLNIPAMDQDFENATPGQQTVWIGAGASDGSTSSFTTPGPYRAGSLEVRVGEVPWAADGYIETDPTTGAWDFTQIPLEGDTPEDNVIEFRYVTAV